MTRKISKNKSNQIKDLLNQGKTIRNIASQQNVSPSTVHKVSKNTGIKSQGSKGRRKKLNHNNISLCVRLLTSNQVKTASNLSKYLKENLDIDVHRSTIARSLKERGMKSGEKKKKPLLSKKHVQARLKFAKEHLAWTVDDWKRVIFSDESKINRFNSDGRSWTWFRDSKTVESRNVNPLVQAGGGGLMVWGCLTHLGPGYLCRIDGSLDCATYISILEDELQQTIEYYDLNDENCVFQQDNASVHKSKATMKWLEENDFELMDWPAMSPDLSPIENLWAILKKRLNTYPTPPNSIQVLWERIEEQWNTITPDLCNKLIESMPNRMKLVVRAKGSWIKY